MHKSNGRRRVVITGMGVVTPLGNDPNTLWSSLLRGESGVDFIKSFPAQEFACKIAATVSDFDPSHYIERKDLKKMDRFVQFALCAALQAVENAGLCIEKEDVERVGVYVGSGIGGLSSIEEQHKVLLEKGPRRVTPFLIPMLIIDIASGWISIYLGIKGPNIACATACATGANAIGDAFRMIERGEVDVMIAGGTEAAITPLGVAGFCAAKALSTRVCAPKEASRPFDRLRDGFVIGEGAACVVLESEEHAKRRGARILAQVCGYGLSADAYHVTSPLPTGEGAAAAMRAALKDANIEPEQIDYINAHGTSTPLNDKCETAAIKSVFGMHAYNIPISSTKSMIGHLLGAAAAVEFVVCVLTIRDGLIHPTINYEYPDPECDLDYTPNKARKGNINTILSNAFGFGGHNVSLVIKRYDAA